MKVRAHVAISTLCAASIYQFNGSESISIAAFLSGIFIDLDHVPDYLLLAKERFSIRSFFSWYYQKRWERIFLFFHSYELMAILFAATYYMRSDALIGISIGSAVHILADQIGNRTVDMRKRMSPWFYFFLFRYMAGFRIAKLMIQKKSESLS